MMLRNNNNNKSNAQGNRNDGDEATAVSSSSQQPKTKARVGVILRQAAGVQKSVNASDELLALQERYRTLCGHLGKLYKALEKRHAAVLQTEKAQTSVAHVFSNLCKEEDGNKVDNPLSSLVGQLSIFENEHKTDPVSNGTYIGTQEVLSHSHTKRASLFLKTILEYVQEWEKTLTTRVTADMRKTDQLRRDADHYHTKVQALQNQVQKLQEKGKDAPASTADKLMRNQEKLDEANTIYQAAAKDLFLLLEEVVDRSWRDAAPLLTRVLQWEIQSNAQQQKILADLKPIVGQLQHLSATKNVEPNRFAGMAEAAPQDLSTRPQGTSHVPLSRRIAQSEPDNHNKNTNNGQVVQSPELPQRTASKDSVDTEDGDGEDDNTDKPKKKGGWASNFGRKKNNSNKEAASDNASQEGSLPSKPSRRGLGGGGGAKSVPSDEGNETSNDPPKASHKALRRPSLPSKDGSVDAPAKQQLAKQQTSRQKDKKKSTRNVNNKDNTATTPKAKSVETENNPFASASDDKWKLTEQQFSGSFTYATKGKQEEVVGKSIAQGRKKMEKNPQKYLLMFYQSNMKDWPTEQQRYTLIHRQGSSGYAPKGVSPSGFMTLLMNHYERLPPLEDNLLPAHCRDDYTDGMSYEGRKLHSKSNRPILPGRGMGVGDTPLLKIIGDVDPSDIHQGSVGDCWLLSGISSLAEFDGAVKRLFRKTSRLDERPLDKPNQYTITLWDLETWTEKDIVIDERLAVTADGSGQLLGAKPSEDDELWVCYLEKALAAHCGGWDKVTGGQCTHAWALLTGCKEQYTIRINEKTGKFACYGKYNPSEERWAKHGNSPHDCEPAMWQMAWPEVGGGGGADEEFSQDELFMKMVAWDQENYIVGAGCSDKSGDAGLVDNHAYSVIESHDNVAGTGIDLIKVRNPWGSGEIEDGMFDDDGPGWEKYPQIKKILNPVVANDGIFWVTKDEFFQFFSTIYLSASNMTEFLED